MDVAHDRLVFLRPQPGPMPAATPSGESPRASPVCYDHVCGTGLSIRGGSRCSCGQPLLGGVAAWTRALLGLLTSIDAFPAHPSCQSRVARAEVTADANTPAPLVEHQRGYVRRTCLKVASSSAPRGRDATGELGVMSILSSGSRRHTGWEKARRIAHPAISPIHDRHPCDPGHHPNRSRSYDADRYRFPGFSTINQNAMT